jgi:hypothetical protein
LRQRLRTKEIYFPPEPSKRLSPGWLVGSK